MSLKGWRAELDPSLLVALSRALTFGTTNLAVSVVWVDAVVELAIVLLTAMGTSVVLPNESSNAAKNQDKKINTALTWIYVENDTDKDGLLVVIQIPISTPSEALNREEHAVWTVVDAMALDGAIGKPSLESVASVVDEVRVVEAEIAKGRSAAVTAISCLDGAGDGAFQSHSSCESNLEHHLAGIHDKELKFCLGAGK